MNVNIEELKRLAKAVINCTDAVEAVHAGMDFMEEIDPAVILSLISEIERVTKQRNDLLDSLDRAQAEIRALEDKLREVTK